jgi:hypothetical protein
LSQSATLIVGACWRSQSGKAALPDWQKERPVELELSDVRYLDLTANRAKAILCAQQDFFSKKEQASLIYSRGRK